MKILKRIGLILIVMGILIIYGFCVCMAGLFVWIIKGEDMVNPSMDNAIIWWIKLYEKWLEKEF